MSERRWDNRRRVTGLLAMGALFLFVFHGALPHQHHDQTSAQNCQVCQLGHSPVQQPVVQANTEPPTASEANPPSEEAFRVLDPVFLADLTRAPPV
jgi:hypothetical protein